MELLIRSQDREKIIKADNIRIKHEYEQKKVKYNNGMTTAYVNGEYRKSHIYTDSDLLGEYKTKERALEVLDEIQNILMPKCIINSKSMKFSKPYEENGMILMECNADARLEQLSTYVYEMPKE